MQDLVIIGAGSFGEDMLDNIRIINEEEPHWNLLGFIDDTRTGDIDGVPVLGNLDAFLRMDKHIQYFVAVMDSKVRERIMNICRAAGFTGAVILHNDVTLEDNVTLGEGSFVGFGSVLMSGTHVGAGVIFEQAVAVCAEVQVGEFSTCRTFINLGKSVRIGKRNYFDLRCTVSDGITTADDCRFAIGTVVLEDIPTTGEYAGVPAKPVTE